MASIILGCDTNNPSDDRNTQEIVASALKKAGHEVQILSVGPNFVQSEMQKSSSKGKVSIFLVNGADLQTYKDFAVGIKQGYYHVKYAYFGLEGWISPSTCSPHGAKTVPLSKAHDDYSSASFTSDILGMTTAQVCEKYKAQIAYTAGNSKTDLANNLVKLLGGGKNSDSANSKSPSTIKESLQKLLSHWDGEVECVFRGEDVYINKIKEPEQNYVLELSEGYNVLSGTVRITDVNPNTTNWLVVNWTGGSLEFKDNKLIERFGEHKAEIQAVKKVVQQVTEEVSDDSSDGGV